MLNKLKKCKKPLSLIFFNLYILKKVDRQWFYLHAIFFADGSKNENNLWDVVTFTANGLIQFPLSAKNEGWTKRPRSVTLWPKHNGDKLFLNEDLFEFFNKFAMLLKWLLWLLWRMLSNVKLLTGITKPPEEIIHKYFFFYIFFFLYVSHFPCRN